MFDIIGMLIVLTIILIIVQLDCSLEDDENDN